MFRIALPLVLLAAVAQPALAQPKPKAARPACGITWLPMVEGREWVYVTAVALDEVSEELQTTLDRAQKSAPKQAEKVTIKVLKVEETAGAATITLEETADQLVQQTTLKCTKDGYEVSPHSFFFAGEPGGGVHMTLGKVETTGAFPGLKGFGPAKKGKTKVALKAEVTREPTKDSGAQLPVAKLELEIELENLGPTTISWGEGGKSTAKVDMIQFQVSGRSSVPPALDKTFEIPTGTTGKFYVQSGLGVLQVANRLGHWYLLQSTR